MSDMRSRAQKARDAEKLAEQELSLPLYPELREEQVAHVADALRNALRSSS